VTDSAALAATLARISHLDEWLAAELEPDGGDGWMPAADLADHLPAVLARVGRRWETDDRRVQAAFFAHEYSWRVAGPAIAAYLAEARVPELAPEHVAVRFDADGSVRPIAFRSHAFAGLTREVNGDALLHHLKRDLEEHLAVTVAALRAHAPLGARALWALAADASASAFLTAGAALGDQGRARERAETFLELSESTLRTLGTFLTLEYGDRSEIFLRRGSCCLSYRIGDHEYCATCPLIPPEETERRLREILRAAASGR
jgi:ferric iron reductase protein FhuF